jgi:uncharacterized membrane protein YjgN (DUF898 family)
MRHCYYGDLQGSFTGTGGELFKLGWRLWLMAVLPLIVAILAPIVRSVAGIPPGGGVVAGLLTMVWLVALPFIYGGFKAVEWRWWISGIRFGEVCFESNLSRGALYGVYCKVIGWFILIAALLALYLYICVSSAVGPFGDLSSTAVRFEGNTPLVVAAVVGYLATILAFNVVLRVYLLRDVWARIVASTTARHLEAVANVAAKGDLANALGEGLSGNLDVVGF